MRDIFAHMDHRKLGRIDAMELIAVILLSIDGSFDSFIRNIVYIFGFSDQTANQPGYNERGHVA